MQGASGQAASAMSVILYSSRTAVHPISRQRQVTLEVYLPSLAHPEPQEHAPIYIANAGLALLYPLLPHFFRQLRLLTEDAGGVARIDGTEAASRAVHLLQYMVDQRCDAPQAELTLNKLLCGLPPDTPLAPAITPDENELALCDHLLMAVIGNWQIFGNSSPAGLRETFLQREGKLVLHDGKWKLTVSRKTIDVLLRQLPWSISVVNNRWMPQPLSVTW